VPQFNDLIARALAAQERAHTLTVDAARVSRLARVLREAHAGGRLLLRCAWCGRLQVGDEWLQLEGIGTGQTRIAEQLVRQSTHGICPDCFERVSDEAAAGRRLDGAREGAEVAASPPPEREQE
jgi:hypothetical protein